MSKWTKRSDIYCVSWVEIELSCKGRMKMEVLHPKTQVFTDEEQAHIFEESLKEKACLISFITTKLDAVDKGLSDFERIRRSNNV